MKKLCLIVSIVAISLIYISTSYIGVRTMVDIVEKGLSIISLKDIFISNKSIDNGILTLVNRKNVLDKNYVPSNLKIPNVDFSYNVLKEEMQMTEESANALEELFNKAKEEEINLYALSGYRSYETQKELYDTYLETKGEGYVNQYIAKPGRSEHQLGLAMDVTTATRGTSFEYTKESHWLKDNAHKFGFIIRYQKDKENITGYSYEPWHIRYVGVHNAQKIYSEDMTLEEFLEF